MLRQLASDVNLSEEAELRRLEGGRPDWAKAAEDDAARDAELDAELDAERSIEASIAEEEEPLLLLSEDEEDYAAVVLPPKAAAVPPARPALKPLGAAHAPRPQHSTPMASGGGSGAQSVAARPAAFARGGERAEVESFSRLRLAGGRALGDQALRSLFEDKACRVLSLANVRRTPPL